MSLMSFKFFQDDKVLRLQLSDLSLEKVLCILCKNRKNHKNTEENHRKSRTWQKSRKSHKISQKLKDHENFVHIFTSDIPLCFSMYLLLVKTIRIDGIYLKAIFLMKRRNHIFLVLDRQTIFVKG